MPPVIRALTDGRAGIRTQVLGLAEALAARTGGRVVEASVRLRPAFAALPERLLAWLVPLGLSPVRLDAPEGGVPDVLIAAGRAGLAASLSARRHAPQVFRVQIQDPRLDPALFDAVIAPAHDGLEGENVLALLGAPNRITPARLAEAKEAWETRLAHLPRPRAAILLGGPSRAYRFGPAEAARIAAGLQDLAARWPGGFLLTGSRRTDPAALATIAAALPADRSFLWDGRGENPFFGFLAHADHVLVTEDSTNMITEAAATGRPVHLLPLAGGSAKFARLHAALMAAGHVRRFGGTLEGPPPPGPLAETARAADWLAQRLSARMPPA
ncbi:MAG: mitochondrial fission ELM1 family protein [Alphaproteobacteria bacterium]|nr:mitochondrial fission ELM1 family protein [Alphaproteobacteria bacterium]